jgi:hypothetical protein
LIAFQRSPVRSLNNGDGPNSPFASAVVKYIAKPGLDIRSALGNVHDEVLRATRDRQEPQVFGSLDALHFAVVLAQIPNRTSSEASAASEAVAPAVAAEPPSAEKPPLAEEAAPPAVAEVPNRTSSEASAPSEAVPPAPASQGTGSATLTSDEICRRDGERLKRLRTNPSREEVALFADDLGCEKLRPQLARLIESLGDSLPDRLPRAEILGKLQC